MEPPDLGGTGDYGSVVDPGLQNFMSRMGLEN